LVVDEHSIPIYYRGSAACPKYGALTFSEEVAGNTGTGNAHLDHIGGSQDV